MCEVVRQVLREFISAAEADGFSLLRRIPSSERFAFLNYYEKIDALERERLKDALATWSAGWFGHGGFEKGEVFERYWSARLASGDWRLWGVRELRLMRAAVKQEPDGHIARNAPKEALDKIMTVETAKAVDLRKVARLAFGQLLGAKPEKRGSIWRYHGRLADEEVMVDIDYGGRLQLRYEVRLPRLNLWQKHQGANYEALLGFGVGWWNQIEQHQEDNAFAVLQDLVRQTVRMALAVHERTARSRG